MLQTVGISEMAVSTDPATTLVTYSLGSCIGVSIYDPEAKVGGLIHCMLPMSKLDAEKARKNPCMFTDTGVVQLIQAMMNAGAKTEHMVVRVAGAAAPMDSEGRFKIGERNYTVLRKVLWKNNLMIASEEVGGTKPRTLKLDMETGKTLIKSDGEEKEL